MTNPGDSDEWWKQYGGEGVSSESGGRASVPPPPPGPSSYGSNPQNPAQPMTPGQSYPSYPQATPPAYGQPAGYGQPPGYGQPAPGYQPYGYPQVNSNNGLAIASLIVSVVGALFCGVGSIVGIILGAVALSQIKQRNQSGRGLALAGIWIGAVAIALWIAYFVIVVVIAAHDGSTSS